MTAEHDEPLAVDADEDVPTTAPDLEITLVEATRRAVAAEPRLRDPRYAAALVNLMRLARKIDAWDVIVQWAIEDQAGKGRGGRPAVPQNDNVSASAYAKQLAELGLTPAGRKSLGQPLRDFDTPERVPAPPAEEKGPTDGGKLSSLDAYRDQAASAR